MHFANHVWKSSAREGLKPLPFSRASNHSILFTLASRRVIRGRLKALYLTGSRGHHTALFRISGVMCTMRLTAAFNPPGGQ